MKTQALRIAFTHTFLELAREDKTLFGVTTDSRGSVTLGDFAKELPAQFVECGIAEQDAVGISAGLASAGLRPFCCGPACFYSLRSAEQVKVDMAYSHENVKIIGVSGGVSYGALGSTHHSIQDIALMRAIPDLEVYLPSDGAQMVEMTKYLAKSNNPAYIRMGRGAVPMVYEGKAPFIAGKANQLKTGKDVAVIACGEMVYPSLKACEILAEQGIQASLYDMHTLRPLDVKAILIAAETGLVVTVEEHNVHGGLGGAVSEVLATQKPTPQILLGLPNEKLYNGDSKQVFEHYGLTDTGIAGSVIEGLKRWKP